MDAGRLYLRRRGSTSLQTWRTVTLSSCGMKVGALIHRTADGEEEDGHGNMVLRGGRQERRAGPSVECDGHGAAVRVLAPHHQVSTGSNIVQVLTHTQDTPLTHPPFAL